MLTRKQLETMQIVDWSDIWDEILGDNGSCDQGSTDTGQGDTGDGQARSWVSELRFAGYVHQGQTYPWDGKG